MSQLNIPRNVFSGADRVFPGLRVNSANFMWKHSHWNKKQLYMVFSNTFSYDQQQQQEVCELPRRSALTLLTTLVLLTNMDDNYFRSEQLDFFLLPFYTWVVPNRWEYTMERLGICWLALEGMILITGRLRIHRHHSYSRAGLLKARLHLTRISENVNFSF